MKRGRSQAPFIHLAAVILLPFFGSTAAAQQTPTAAEAIMTAKVKADEANAIVHLKNYVASQVEFQVNSLGEIPGNVAVADRRSYCDNFRNLHYGRDRDGKRLEFVSPQFADAFAAPTNGAEPPADAEKRARSHKNYSFFEDPGVRDWKKEYGLIAYPHRLKPGYGRILCIDDYGTIFFLKDGVLNEADIEKSGKPKLLTAEKSVRNAPALWERYEQPPRTRLMAESMAVGGLQVYASAQMAYALIFRDSGQPGYADNFRCLYYGHPSKPEWIKLIPPDMADAFLVIGTPRPTPNGAPQASKPHGGYVFYEDPAVEDWESEFGLVAYPVEGSLGVEIFHIDKRGLEPGVSGIQVMRQERRDPTVFTKTNGPHPIRAGESPRKNPDLWKPL